MKLLTKTILYYLLICIPLLVIAAICSYFLINGELQESVDESLAKELPVAINLIDSWKEPHTTYLSADRLSYIKPITQEGLKSNFTDTSIYHQDEFENYRVLNKYYHRNGIIYQIAISKTTIEKDELMEGLFSSFVLITFFLLIAFFICNWLLSQKLWKPFYQTLRELANYDIKKHQRQKFAPASILEFDQLNTGLNKMTDKIHSDFIQLKEFTENASHEMQTPLAVAKANLSLLMQSSNLKEEEMDQLQVLENTIKKLASLHKTLMLLAKIENNQYVAKVSVHLKKVVMHNLEQYGDFIEAKKIQLQLELDHALQTNMDPALADILISNLLQNAIRHNKNQGNIFIRSTADTLILANTGEPLSIQTDELFFRFKKEDASSNSLGLGLAIVKSITSLYDFEITYSFSSANLHTFTLKI
jgi:two-component system OmpR family sensor kinase